MFPAFTTILRAAEQSNQMFYVYSEILKRYFANEFKQKMQL